MLILFELNRVHQSSPLLSTRRLCSAMLCSALLSLPSPRLPVPLLRGRGLGVQGKKVLCRRVESMFTVTATGAHWDTPHLY